MTREYTSSPVEHPATQARTDAPLALPSRIWGKISFASASNAAGSRKKEVTWMSTSSQSARASSSSLANKCR